MSLCRIARERTGSKPHQWPVTITIAHFDRTPSIETPNIDTTNIETSSIETPNIEIGRSGTAQITGPRTSSPTVANGSSRRDGLSDVTQS
jgi:hypothetical protein